MNQPVPRKASAATARGSVADSDGGPGERAAGPRLPENSDEQSTINEGVFQTDQAAACAGGTGAHRLSARRAELKKRARPERANSYPIAGMNPVVDLLLESSRG